MLRAATKKSVEQGIKSVRSQSTQLPKPPSAPVPPPPPQPGPKSSKKSGGGKFALTVAALTAGAGGVVGYAYVDPEFRNKVETTVPQVKPVFETLLGSSSLPKTKQQITDLIPKKKAEDVLPPLARTPIPSVEKKPPVHVDPVNVKKPIAVLPVKASPEEVAAKNKALEASLIAAIQAAESKVHVATDAKVQTISAINGHAETLKQTVDAGQNANWENVTKALTNAESFARRDASAESDSRNYIDNLKKIIDNGKSTPLTATNPLLINATETANKLSHQLDELNGLVSKARQESAILNQYKDLIDKSRQQFAQEMKSILPNVDIHAKNKTLNEEELNALIAHAHLKVDQLRRQLTEQQLREEQHISNAIEDQRRADERISADRLVIELQRVKDQQQLDTERAILQTRSTWENELEDQLKRTAAAHSEHLEQVIRTQRQLFEIEHNQKVEEAVLVERDHHSRQVGVAISRLEGIEEALNSRVALDAENRKAKQFWIACHNLIDTIQHGKKSGNTIEERRFPLNAPLTILKEVNPDDEFVNVLVAAFPTQSVNKGVYTEQDLRNRFNTVYKLGKRTAHIDANGGTITAYVWSYIRSVFLLDIPRKFTETDKIDPLTVDNNEVLARAKWFVDRGDFEGAVRVTQLLSGEPSLLAKDWIVDTRAHLEARLLAQLLVAHAAVSSIRSTY